MKTIKEIITDAAVQDALFFTPKDKNQFKKIFRILKSIGFKYSSGGDLSDSYLFGNALGCGSFRIDKKGCIAYGSKDTYTRNYYNEKNIFDFFKELNITIESKASPFFIDWVDSLSSVKTKCGISARIICSDLKNEKQLVFAYSLDEKTENVSIADNNGKTWLDDFNLVLESETVELKTTEMTIQEIEKALNIKNLKIVK